MNTPNTILCPICQDQVHKLLFRFHIDSEKAVLENIKKQYPEWHEYDGICSRCVDYYHTEIVMQQRLLPEVGPYFPVKSPDDFIILPTPIRIDADPRYTGKGITICFIDSGFFPHPDLVASRNRIKLMLDLTAENTSTNNIEDDSAAAYSSSPSLWHGTMTTVVCAGDGYCSKGLYKGIACRAELVLLKVQDEEGRITTENIIKALKWIQINHRQYNIKVVNISLGDDKISLFKDSAIDQLADELVNQGIVVVAAAGNDTNAAIKPPASSPNVITVGGLDDYNQLDTGEIGLYHSSYGETQDGFRKPELIAQAIWIAAPILPGTKEKEEAESLHDLHNTPDEMFAKKFIRLHKKINWDVSSFGEFDVTFLKQKIGERIQQTKFFSADYMHVDGTSFAAPIVSSVIAQLLEAEPALTPPQIRNILFSTATRLHSLPVERQGFGYVRPRKAIFKILKKEVIMTVHESPFINRRKKTIEFYIQNGCANQISLSGTFNHWAQDVLLLEPGKDGKWKIEIPMLPKGKYYYKFFIDDRMWVEDVDNPWREPDGLNGWNSVLVVDK